MIANKTTALLPEHYPVSGSDIRYGGPGNRYSLHISVYVKVNLEYIGCLSPKTIWHSLMQEEKYTISELAKEFGVTTRTIRFYEEKGLVTPLREGLKRLYTPADRVRIKLILRGKRIGMTLRECVEFIDMYDPEHNNAEQLHSLISDVKLRRESLQQQRKDIDDMLSGLGEVQALCEQSLKDRKDDLKTQTPDES